MIVSKSFGTMKVVKKTWLVDDDSRFCRDLTDDQNDCLLISLGR